MNEKKINEAIRYAEMTNKIEDLNLSNEEKEQIKNALLNDKKDDSFLFSIVREVNEEKELKGDKDGKAKRNIRI